ncbi:MAG: phosphoribosyltransferase family protein [Ilumatobacteraceae bacterium]
MRFLRSTCPVCRRSTSTRCASCWSGLPPAPASAAAPAALAFDGSGRRLLLAMKYGNGRTLADPLAELMAAAVVGDHDLVTWAPTSARRRHRRGFDQGELLARALARRLGLPCRALLRRVGRGGQTGRSRDERLGTPPRFVARPARAPWRVLLVDDVVTTGATMAAAERALRRAGYPEIGRIAAAATP